MFRKLAVVALLLMLSVSVLAQTVTPAPELLNFQGRLAKPDGTPVADGTYVLRFSLWSAVSNGTEKWHQVMDPVLVKKGTFSVLLGNGNPITADILNGSEIYLEIKVGNDTPLSPRQRIASVAYALKANSVPDSAITTAKIADGAITASKLGAGVAASIGGVPSGYLILGYTPTAPAGYTYTGETISNTWATLTSLPNPRTSRPATVAFNGKIYVIGGGDGINRVDTTSIYNPVTGIWTTGKPMPSARQAAAVALLNGKIHMIGGTGNDGAIHTDHYVYDPVADNWVSKAPVPIATAQASAVGSGNTLYFIGGTTGSAIATTYAYNDVSDTWSLKNPMSAARSNAGIALVGQSIYIFGGWAGSNVLSSTEVYDIASNAWSPRASFPTPRQAPMAAVVNGKISLLGGNQAANSGGVPGLSTNEEYDPVTNVWSSRPAMPTGRAYAGVTALNNSIYVIGGTDSNIALTTHEVYTPGKVYHLFLKN